MIDKRPALIARCTGVADVRQAVAFARAHQLLVAVRGGSHNVAGYATCDGGLVIDLSPMKGIWVDPVRRRVRAQGGVLWGELDRETQAFGLATTGGTDPTTGIAGLTLGGGVGWLQGKYGLAVDNLLSADVVTADGRCLTASATAFAHRIPHYHLFILSQWVEPAEADRHIHWTRAFWQATHRFAGIGVYVNERSPQMRIIPLAFMIALLGVMSTAYALCVPGTVDSCYLDGKQGTRTCLDNGFFGPCEVPLDPEPPSGTAQTKYKILTVIYAPPGTQGGGSASSVTYGSGSTAGSTVSASHTFKQGYAVSVLAKGGVLSKAEIGVSFGYSRSSSDSEELEIKKTTSTVIRQNGPAVDGIDHDRDLIWLWLCPIVQLSLTPTAAEWTVDDSQIAKIQYVYVGWLKEPSAMPQDVMDQLQACGITTDDFAEILQANPFADDTLPIETDRFEALPITFPYEPPYAPGDSPPTLTFNHYV
jgi:hypothetical protein